MQGDDDETASPEQPAEDATSPGFGEDAKLHSHLLEAVDEVHALPHVFLVWRTFPGADNYELSSVAGGQGAGVGG